jgi:hypothetical protein
MQIVKERGWTLGVVESGLNGELSKRLASVGFPFYGGEVIIERPQLDRLAEMVLEFRQKSGVEVGLGVVIYPGGEKQDVHLILITPQGRQDFHRPFGGPPDYAVRYALHHSLDLIRQV